MCPPTPPAKRARFLLVIRPREYLFPPPSRPRNLARGETGSSGEELPGKSDRLEEEESAGCKSVKRVMAPLQKNAAPPDAPRRAFCLLPSHRGVAARFQGRPRGSRRGGRDERGEPIARSPTDPDASRKLSFPSLLSFGEGEIGLKVSGNCGRGHLSSPLYPFSCLSEAKKNNGIGGRVCRSTAMGAEQERETNAGSGQLLIPVSSRAAAKWLSGVGGWGKERAFPDGCKNWAGDGKQRKPSEICSWTICWNLVGGYHPTCASFGTDLLLFLLELKTHFLIQIVSTTALGDASVPALHPKTAFAVGVKQNLFPEPDIIKRFHWHLWGMC